MGEQEALETPTLGQMLRERREARGLSQEEAAQRSRVQLVFVRALEADDYRLLPDELYLTRFVYEYAGFLGLDPGAAAQAFRGQLRRPGATSPLYKAVPLVATLPWRQLFWAAAIFLILIPVALIVLSLAGKERPEQPASSPPAAWEVSGSPPGTRPPDAEPLSPGSPGRLSAEPSAGAPSDAGEPAPRRHFLEARGRGVTWVAVRVDGEPEVEVWLREGEIRRWVAEQGFVLSVGNTRSVDILLDGEGIRLPDRGAEGIRGLRFPSPSAPQMRETSLGRPPVSRPQEPRAEPTKRIESKGGNAEPTSADAP